MDSPRAFLTNFEEVKIDYDYSKFTQKTLEWSLNPDQGIERYFNTYRAGAKPESIFGDQIVLQAPSSVCAISLAENHPLIVECGPIRADIGKIDIKIEAGTSSEPAKGKRKKGAKQVKPDSKLLTIEVYLTSQPDSPTFSYPIAACVQGRLIEFNKKVLADPFCLFDLFKTEAYLAIMLPEKERLLPLPKKEEVGDQDKEASFEELEPEIEEPEILPIEISENRFVKIQKTTKRERKYLREQEELRVAALDPNFPTITLQAPIFSFETPQ